jgi:hypothetical protein
LPRKVFCANEESKFKVDEEDESIAQVGAVKKFISTYEIRATLGPGLRKIETFKVSGN